MNEKRFNLIIDIANRAEEMNLMMFDKFSLIMDLQLADEEFNLRLNDFLNADNFNFSHDILGIQQSINRHAKKFEGLFLPRFTGH